LQKRLQTTGSSVFKSDLWLHLNATCQCFILVVQLFYKF